MKPEDCNDLQSSHFNLNARNSNWVSQPCDLLNVGTISWLKSLNDRF